MACCVCSPRKQDNTQRAVCACPPITECESGTAHCMDRARAAHGCLSETVTGLDSRDWLLFFFFWGITRKASSSCPTYMRDLLLPVVARAWSRHSPLAAWQPPTSAASPLRWWSCPPLGLHAGFAAKIDRTQPGEKDRRMDKCEAVFARLDAECALSVADAQGH